MWYLIALVWLALIIGIFWIYGSKRRRADSERAKEIGAFLAEAKMGIRAAAEPSPVAAAGAVALSTLPVAQVSPFERKPRMLARPDALLYLLFRTGLPDHEVFVNLMLADVIEPAPTVRGYERDQLARKLSLQRLNMVVCNKQLEIVAAVLCGAGTYDEYIESCLTAAGVRLVRIDPAALPRHQQVRALVYGDTAPGTA